MNVSRVKTAAGKSLEILQRHPYLALAGAAIVFYIVVFAIPGFLIGFRDGVRDAVTNRAIEQTKDHATTEKTAAEQERMKADENAIDRKIEDRYREEKLQPDRLRATRSLAESRARRQQAEEKHEKARLNPSAPDPDDSNLRKRNCADLTQLFPDKQFAGCQ